MTNPRYSSLVVSLLLIAALTKSHADELVNVNCNADLVCVKVYKGRNVDIFLENKTHKPLSFRLIFTTENLSHLNLKTHTLSRPTTAKVVSFPTPVGPWGYEYRIHYGYESHQHDERYPYTLPYEPGSTYLVTQSHTNISTHHFGNLYAIDWAMPIGDPVHAAREGTVVSTYKLAKVAGAEEGSGTANHMANHIWIQHSDGTIGKYLHLDHNGVYVREGHRVGAGQLIGAAGNTGFSSGPHLHFSVSTLGGETLYQTINVQFDTNSGPRYLVGGRRYSHP